MQWHSAHSDKMLDENGLIREVMLKTICREYWLLNAIGCSRPEIQLYSNGIGMASEDINFRAFTPVPDELIGLFKANLNLWLSTTRDEFGLVSPGVEVLPPIIPPGEKVGEMLHYFKAMKELIAVCIARDCWDKSKLLLIHGLRTDFPSTYALMTELNRANIYYILVFNNAFEQKAEKKLNLSDEDIRQFNGTGAFRAISKYDAANIASALNNGNRDLVAQALNLQSNYFENSWTSNNPDFMGTYRPAVRCDRPEGLTE